MAYRDDLEVLNRRIDELERDIRERTKERDRLDSLSNLGPEAYGLYSRLMYRLGRGVGRARWLFARKLGDPARAIEAARRRVRLLEGKLADLEEEVRLARELAGSRGLKDIDARMKAEWKKKNGGPTL